MSGGLKIESSCIPLSASYLSNNYCSIHRYVVLLAVRNVSFEFLTRKAFVFRIVK